MKRSALVGGSVRCVLLAATLGLAAPVCPAQKRASSTREEVAALLKAHDDAHNQQNLEAVMALYAPGPKTAVIGTGPGELYQGQEGIKAAYTEFFKDFDKGTQSQTCQWREGGRAGTWLGARPCASSPTPKAGRSGSMR